MHIVIIGLPGSGKTSLLNKYKNTHIIHDDFMGSFFTGQIYSDLENGKQLCLADPRLCDIRFFNQYISANFSIGNTKLILFENDPDKCLKNIIVREDNKNIIRWENTINRFTEKYHINNYEGWNLEIIPVFTRDGDIRLV